MGADYSLGEVPGVRPTNDMETGEVGADRILLTEDGVIIEWSDGQRCRYPARELRINCGCAECVEEWSQRRILDPASVPADIRAEDYLLVGRYAVQFLWSDAHYTGLYTHQFLRDSCPCEVCALGREEVSTPEA